jgi:hypothetical protein
MAKNTKSNFLVHVSGISGNFRTSGGGSVTAATSKDFDGGATKPTILGGLQEWSDLTITRSFDPVRDLPIIAKLIKQVGTGKFTVTKQATDANMTKVGKPIVYPKCVLNALTYPDSDANASDASEFTLGFATTGPAD